MKLKIGDFFVIIIAIVAICYSFTLLNKYPLLYVKVTTPYKTLIYPLKKDNIYTVKGAIGKLTLEVKNGKVRVLKSSCKNKICIKTGWISTSNGYIACVPNKILITLISRKKKENYDFITK